MERARLKSVIIIILALLNAFLLFSLITQESAEQTTHRRMEEQLILLFAADGMTMEEGTLPREKPPTALTMSRDAAREQAAAAFFLGEGVSREEQGGGAASYAGAAGTALFREDGSFEVSGRLAAENTEEVCRTFCEKFSCSEPVFLLDGLGSGTATAAGMHDGRRVINGSITFRFEKGTLTDVSGILLPESGTAAVSDTEMLSAAAALTAFQNARRETGAVVSAVTEVSLCWQLQSTASSPMALVPTWCIVTDTSRYYVNSSTGAVTTG